MTDNYSIIGNDVPEQPRCFDSLGFCLRFFRSCVMYNRQETDVVKMKKLFLVNKSCKDIYQTKSYKNLYKKRERKVRGTMRRVKYTRLNIYFIILIRFILISYKSYTG